MKLQIKKLLLFSIFLSTILFAYGQNKETDSLKKLLDTVKEGPGLVQVYQELSYAYVSAYPDTALQYALKGLQLAQKIKDRRGETHCVTALGNVYFTVGDYPKALEMYLSSLKIKEKLNYLEDVAVTYFNIANVYTEQEDYRHALYNLFKAMQMDQKVKDSTGILYDLYSLSSIYLRMGNADSALYFGHQALRLAQQRKDENLIGAIVNNFGEIYAFQKNFSFAVKYYHSSIPYAEAISDNEVLASDYYGLAKVYQQKALLDSSAYYARTALSIAQDAPFLKQVFEISAFLSGLYKTQKQYDSAFKYLELSTATKDSLFNVEQVKKVQNLKLMEQQRQQSIETAKAEYRNKVKLYFVLFVSCIFLAIAVLLWRNNKQKQKAYTLLQQQKAKTDQALEELTSTQAQLIQREKMASLGELTAGVAHEIQNPLNFIINFSEVSVELVDELEKATLAGNKDESFSVSADIKDNLKKISHHGKRADSIVKNMMEHSRSGLGQKELTDINMLADEYMHLAYHGFRAKNKSFGATLQTDFDENMEKLNIVPQNMGRVLVNLLNNAFYSVKEKKKQLNNGYEPVISVSTKKFADRVEVRVKDNGFGVPQKIIDKIFQPFFTTKPTGEGVGLGLSLSYDIVTQEHDGEMKVETQEGEYADFIIQLPLNTTT